MGKASRRRRARQGVVRSSYPRPATARMAAPPSPPRTLTAWTAYPTPVAAALGRLAELVIEREVARSVVLGHDERIRTAVARLRLDGASWGQIGSALGISRQGARQRFDSAARATRRTSEVRTEATASRTRSDVLRTPAPKSADEQEVSRWTSWRL